MPDPISYDDTSRQPEQMPALLERFQADRDSLERCWAIPHSLRWRERLRAFLAEWRETVGAVRFDTLSRSDRVDWLLFRRLLGREERRLLREERQFAEMDDLLPFAADLVVLEEERRALETIDAAAVAERLEAAQVHVRELGVRLAAARAEGEEKPLFRPTVAFRAAQTVERLCRMLEEWFGHYHGYDPLFTWWVERPYRALDASLREYGSFLRRELAGAENEESIIGDPLGRDTLLEELEFALIPYSPEELMEIARQEQAWCLTELRRAAAEMGCGDDWRAALERVKSAHAAPGEQPALVRDLAREAIAYLQTHDLVTVPPLAAECWRLTMMSPEKQKVNPFFLGGETIQVSFPTHTMEHAQKRMSLRGNNRHFSRATVQHELIPGHHLQGFFQERYRPYRRLFSTPFWIEGWTLHWEMLLWDRGFAQSPEDRIGMLFWRLHRCARVIFSLGFHLGEMTPRECVELLVNDVGHERDNALAEVRRSFGGDYDPLYQLAYLIGGLQVRALHREVVGPGRMTDRAFHDAVLRENSMPIAVLRALLTGEPLEREFRGAWRFYDHSG
jgi:hypothetical protein